MWKSVIFLSIMMLLGREASACPVYPPIPFKAKSVSDPDLSTGNQKLLIVAVDFSDAPGIYTLQSMYDQYFGNWNTGSLAEYYSTISYGALQYSGDVVGLKNGIPTSNSATVTYVRAPNPLSYYANNNSGLDVYAFPKNAAGLAYHVFQTLDNAGFDFSSYRRPGSLTLPSIILMTAGNSPVSQSSNNGLWALSYSIEYDIPGGYKAKDGSILKGFAVSTDRDSAGSRAGIAVTAHEHGHNLGLPDLYDLSIQTTGVGYYDLMGYGLYGDPDLHRPFHPAAPMKERLKWITPTVLAPNSTGQVSQFSLPPFETTESVIKLLPENGSTKEYFLLENRQGGNYHQFMPYRGLCKGLYIWHVDNDIIDTYLLTNTVNSTGAYAPSHIGVQLVEADGQRDLTTAPVTNTSYGECDDAFQVGSQWNSNSMPNSRLWNGEESGFTVEVVSESSGSLILAINASGTVSPTPTGTSSPNATPAPTAPPGATPSAPPTIPPTGLDTPKPSPLRVVLKLTKKEKRRKLEGYLRGGAGSSTGKIVSLLRKSSSKSNYSLRESTVVKRGGGFTFKKTVIKGNYKAQVETTFSRVISVKN